MRGLYVILTVFLMLIFYRPVFSQDYTALELSHHPRLFLSEEDFSSLKLRVSSASESDSVLISLHELILERANTIGLDSNPIEYKYDESGLRLLHRSREALQRILLCSYAYRFSGETKYLRHAISDLDVVCSFPTWNAERHFLDAAEMALAVAVGYDWLYDNLPGYIKERAFKALNEFAFQPSANPDWSGFYYSEGNWNQVCNAGLVAGSIATYEKSDTTAQRIISDAITTNSRIMGKIYSPDGNYPEGPGYWSYGNMFEAILLTELEDVFGRDFGISNTLGFANTANYKEFTVRPGGKVFNYSDNMDALLPSYPLWYFAKRFGDTSVLNSEVALLSQGKYEDVEEVRVLPLLMAYALKIGPIRDKQTKSSVYFGRGTTPVLMAKGNSSLDGSEYYLGVKAGTTTTSHSHMDCGSFVYDAFGHNWAIDLNRQEYVEVENIASAHFGNFWDLSQNALRWKFLRMNNRFHNTITINDTDHYVKGKTEIIRVIDTLGYRGAVIDMTQLFKGQAQTVIREVVINANGELKVTDTVSALDTLDADIRFSMVTPSDVCHYSEGLLLSQDNTTLSLTCESEDTPIIYNIWSTDPKGYDYIFSEEESSNPGAMVCGYNARVEKGKTAVFTTVLQKL